MGKGDQEYKIVFAALPECKWLEHPVLFVFNIVSGQKMHEHLLELMEAE